MIYLWLCFFPSTSSSPSLICLCLSLEVLDQLESNVLNLNILDLVLNKTGLCKGCRAFTLQKKYHLEVARDVTRSRGTRFDIESFIQEIPIVKQVFMK